MIRYLEEVVKFGRKNGILLTAVLTVVVFSSLFVLGEGEEVGAAVLSFNVWRIGAVIGLVSLSYGIRFLRWEFYLRELDSVVPGPHSRTVFFSGLMMSVTPGKAGEVWKAWFLRDLSDVPVGKTVSVVTAERVTDLLALSTFALLGLVIYQRSSAVVIGVIAVLVCGVALIQWRAFCLWLIGKVEDLPVVGQHSHKLEVVYESAYVLFRLRPMSIALFVSLLAWGLEGVALWVVLAGFDIHVSLQLALFVFGLGSVVGAASLLPGGLAATEATMVGLLILLGYSQTVAATSTLMIRIGTLWYGVGLGTAVFLTHRIRYG